MMQGPRQRPDSTITCTGLEEMTMIKSILIPLRLECASWSRLLQQMGRKINRFVMRQRKFSSWRREPAPRGQNVRLSSNDVCGDDLQLRR